MARQGACAKLHFLRLNPFSAFTVAGARQAAVPAHGLGAGCRQNADRGHDRQAEPRGADGSAGDGNKIKRQPQQQAEIRARHSAQQHGAQRKCVQREQHEFERRQYGRLPGKLLCRAERRFQRSFLVFTHKCCVIQRCSQQAYQHRRSRVECGAHHAFQVGARKQAGIRAQNAQGFRAHEGQALLLVPRGRLGMPRQQCALVAISQIVVNLVQRPVLQAGGHLAGAEVVEVLRLDAGEPGKSGLHQIAHLPGGQQRHGAQ